MNFQTQMTMRQANMWGGDLAKTTEGGGNSASKKCSHKSKRNENSIGNEKQSSSVNSNGIRGMRDRYAYESRAQSPGDFWLRSGDNFSIVCLPCVRLWQPWRSSSSCFFYSPMPHCSHNRQWKAPQHCKLHIKICFRLRLVNCAHREGDI